jgi:type IV secretion system protein VirB10
MSQNPESKVEPSVKPMVQEGVKHEPQEGVDNSPDTKASPEVGEELSKVAVSPKRNVLVFASLAIGFVFMAWKLIGSEFNGKYVPDPTADSAPLPKGESVETPSEVEDSTPPIPQLPEPPKLIEPTPPLPPAVTEEPKDAAPPLPDVVPPPAAEAPQAAALPTGMALGGTGADDANARLDAKRKSPIQLVGGASGGGTPEATAEASKTDAEKTQSSDFKKRGDLNYVLGKGKVIDVITETAINSDHVSEVRAVVTRDVYAESGKIILIPKGTRVFGEFTTDTSAGYGRVNVKWNRIDLATGYTINISSPAVDSLGRAGAHAVVDNKYKEQMANALLSSAFSIAVAAAVDKMVPPVQSTQGAANTQQANNLQSTALAIFNDTSKNEDTRRAEICTSVQNAFPDKTSSAFTTFSQACITASTAAGTPAEKLATIMTAVTGAATGLVSTTAAASTPTHKQQAAEQAFKDLSGKMEDIVQQQALKPTVTVDQGAEIRIYINKDYLFPKDAVSRARVLR